MIGTAMRSPALLSAAPAPNPTPPDREPQAGAAAHPFAELLRQNRHTEAPPPAPTQASTPPEAKDRADAARAEDSLDPSVPGTPASQRDAKQARVRNSDAARATVRSTGTPQRSTAAADSARDGKDDPAAGATTASADAPIPTGTTDALRPDPAPRMAPAIAERASPTGTHATGPDNASRGLTAAGDTPSAGAGALDVNTRATAPANASESRRATLDAAEARSDKASDIDARASTGPSFAEALAESKAQPHSTATAPLDAASPGAAGPAAPLAEPTRAAAPGADSAVTTSTVPVAVDSPEFAAAFGLQVSTLARDGIQRAELHLNPTDMGPVSIQITLDGTQARVDFGADVAATRHAIETGLPELASALRDAGFTLAGGGVAEHSRSNGGHADDGNATGSGSRRGTPDAIAKLDAAAQRVTRRIAAGGVDLYA